VANYFQTKKDFLNAAKYIAEKQEYSRALTLIFKIPSKDGKHLDFAIDTVIVFMSFIL